MSIPSSPTVIEIHSSTAANILPTPKNTDHTKINISIRSLWENFNNLTKVAENDHRALKITKNIFNRAKTGLIVYICLYGVFRLCLNKRPIQLAPFLINSVARQTLIEVGKLVYDGALVALGEREIYENLENSGTTYAYERLRQRSWKIISKFENLASSVDAAFSNLVGIRSAKEIRESFKTDEAYLLESHLTEIVREGLFSQIKSLYQLAINFLSCHYVQSLGYEMPVLENLYTLKGIQKLSCIQFLVNIFHAYNFRSYLIDGIKTRTLNINEEGNIQVFFDQSNYNILKIFSTLHFTNQRPDQTQV